MTAKFTQDEINLRELAVDMCDVSATVAKNTNALLPLQAYAGKNLLINGDMSVWQRETSFTGGVAKYAQDRWRMDSSSGDVSRSTESPSGGYSCYFTNIVTNATVRQGVELPGAGMAGVFTKGQKLTISMMVKSEHGNESIKVYMPFVDEVGSTTNQSLDNTSAHSLGLTTTEWQRFIFSFEITQDVNPTNTALEVVPYVALPTGDIWITDVQLELGSEFTGFEIVPTTINLVNCQRYYAKGNVRGLVATYSTSSAFAPCVQFPVEMRIAPTIVATISSYFWDGATATTGDVSGNSITTSAAGMLVFNIVPTPTDNSNGYGTVFWAADAEI